MNEVGCEVRLFDFADLACKRSTTHLILIRVTEPTELEPLLLMFHGVSCATLSLITVVILGQR